MPDTTGNDHHDGFVHDDRWIAPDNVYKHVCAHDNCGTADDFAGSDHFDNQPEPDILDAAVVVLDLDQFYSADDSAADYLDKHCPGCRDNDHRAVAHIDIPEGDHYQFTVAVHNVIRHLLLAAQANDN